jgi:hypothetical protein
MAGTAEGELWWLDADGTPTRGPVALADDIAPDTAVVTSLRDVHLVESDVLSPRRVPRSGSIAVRPVEESGYNVMFASRFEPGRSCALVSQDTRPIIVGVDIPGPETARYRIVVHEDPGFGGLASQQVTVTIGASSATTQPLDGDEWLQSCELVIAPGVYDLLVTATPATLVQKISLERL